MKSITGPKQTVILSCRGKNTHFGKTKEHDNLITLDWHMLSSKSPPMYAVSIGKKRFSLSLLRDSGVFCINFLNHDMHEIALRCGQSSGLHIDKFKENEIQKQECEKIDCPRIKNCASHIECEIRSEIESGDHVVFIGEVVNGKLHNHSKRLFNDGKRPGVHEFKGL
jgi:flavin reductase (DIM6/NTAB) family NADH-FMN oxidoreductase RutF